MTDRSATDPTGSSGDIGAAQPVIGIRRLWTPRRDPFHPPLLAYLSGLTYTRSHSKAVKPADFEALNAFWSAEVRKRSARGQRSVTIGRAYDGAITRGIRIEAKAIGLLQVIAVGFAVIALIAGRDGLLLRAVSAASILYLVLATVGVLALMNPAPRPQVGIEHGADDSGGLLATAVAAAGLEAANPVDTNWLRGVVIDLQVGFGAAILGLVLTVAGVGDPGPSRDQDQPTTSTSAPVDTSTSMPSRPAVTEPSSTVAPSPPTTAMTPVTSSAPSTTRVVSSTVIEPVEGS